MRFILAEYYVLSIIKKVLKKIKTKVYVNQEDLPTH